MKSPLLLTTLILSSALCATDSKLTLRHRESQGVGYNQGYSTLEYFLTAQREKLELIFDIRGHLFNNAKVAGNCGLGLRYSLRDDSSRFGVNAFYDFRDFHFFSNQISGGFEWISRTIDIRLNGYLPVGNQRSFQTHTFQGFAGNQMLVRRKFSSTLPCLEGEVGTATAHPFYFAAGTYYLFQESSHSIRVGRTWGWKARFDVDIGNHFSLGAIVTHDRIFNTRVQGYLALNIPLGPWKSPAKNPQDLRHRPIVHNEIIPIQTRKDSKMALTSHDDLLSHFIFVNNLAVEALGDGTFEHPFVSLKKAEKHSKPGDVIYVYPGDGTPHHMDEGIVLKNNQILASSKSPLTIHDIEIPSQTPSSAPVITNIHPERPIVTNPGNSDLKNFIFMTPWDYLRNYHFPSYPTQPLETPSSVWEHDRFQGWDDAS